MVAVVPMFDPPRHDTKETIERCIEKGIMVKMVTGDQLLIGKETAKQLGMGQNFYTTEELMEVRASQRFMGLWVETLGLLALHMNNVGGTPTADQHWNVAAGNKPGFSTAPMSSQRCQLQGNFRIGGSYKASGMLLMVDRGFQCAVGFLTVLPARAE